ncbi:hypothetical protein AAMO2058_000455300 [Amorphochlora amoebiformis]
MQQPADTAIGDPYADIDCPKWVDLENHDNLNSTQEIDKYWDLKNSSTLKLDASFEKMRISDVAGQENVESNSNRAPRVSLKLTKKPSIPVSQGKNNTETLKAKHSELDDSTIKLTKKNSKMQDPSVFDQPIQLIEPEGPATVEPKREILKDIKPASKSTRRKKKKPSSNLSVFERLFAQKKKGVSSTPRSRRTKKMYSKSARKPYKASTLPKKSSKTKKKPGHVRSLTLTKAKTPNITKSRPRRIIKGTLEKEMDEIKKLHQEAEKRRKLNAKQLHKIFVPKSQYTQRSTKALTEPEEFTFVTSARLGYKTSKEASIKKRKPRASMMKVNGLTNPISFNLETNRRSKISVSSQKKASPYVPLQAKVNNFFKKATERKGEKKTTYTGGITCPNPPRLSTLSRGRKQSVVLSQEEKELLEMKSFEKFKARPINPKIFTSGGEFGVPRVEKKKPTKFSEFKLSSAARKSTVRRSMIPTESKPKTFKAKPFNAKMFKQAPVARRSASSLTKPISPNLNTSKLVHKYIKDPVKPTHRKERKPVVVGSLTEPVGFNLETERRGKHYQEEFQTRIKIEEAELEMKMHPHAKKMPKFKTPNRHSTVVLRDLTEPQPFHLQSEALSREARTRWEEKVAHEQEEEARLASSFKAKPIKWNDNFFLFASKKELTRAEPFHLHTESRKEESMAKRLELARMRKEVEERKIAEIAKQKAMEEEEDRIRRAQNVHKPLSMPDMKAPPAPLRKSTKTLTQAISPEFALAKRSRSKTELNH